MTQAERPPEPAALRPLEAPRRRKRNLLPYWIGLGVVVVTGGVMLGNGLTNNLTFYVLPSEYRDREAEFVGRTLQLGGVVQKGSVQFDRKNLRLSFVVSDQTVSYPVIYQGAVPDLFKPGEIVLVEGRMNAGTFEGSRLLIKHSEEYKAAPAGSGQDLRKFIDSTL